MARGQGTGPHKTGKRAILAEDRKRIALEMRRDGHTLAEIQGATGYKSRGAVQKAIETALLDARREDTNALFELELERLDRWLERLKVKIEAGDTGAISTALRVSERRCKLLGLDREPVQQMAPEAEPTIEFDGGNGVRVLIDRETSIAVARAAMSLPPTPPAQEEGE